MEALQSYTCISCGLTFDNTELQKEHYKTDWHRFNLNRRVAGLAGVTVDVYERHVQSQQETKHEGRYRKISCDICHKTFSSQKGFEQHERSKRHIERVRISENSPDDQKEEPPMDNNADVKMGDAINLSECLFCRHKSRSFPKNMKHMTRIHSLFIPDIEFLIDLRGFIKYLGEKIGIGHYCLWCNRSFGSLEAVQKHMTDLSHCKLDYEDNEDEYAEFYGFGDEEEAVTVETKDTPMESVKVQVSPEDEDWEDVDWSGEEEEEEERSAKVHTNAKVVEEEKPIPPSIDLPRPAIVTASGELVLGSGEVLGHRDMKRYYKQEQGPMLTRRTGLIDRLLTEYKSLGWHCGSTEVPKIVSERRKAMKAQQKFGGNKEKAFELGVGVRANKLQTFYRVQL